MKNSNRNKPKMINRLHLIYTFIISICIIVAIIVCQKNSVCPTAFTNFSFAATITSIVLAVVSIVYSIQSGLNTSDQMSGMREIEGRISNELKRFRFLESRIRKSFEDVANPIKEQMKDLREDQVGMRQTIEEYLNPNNAVVHKVDSSNSNKFPYTSNSQWGNILLYACCLSYKRGKSLPQDILDKYSKEFSYYFYGYIVAISSALPQYFTRSGENTPTGSKVTQFDENYFGKEEDIKKIVDPYRENQIFKSAISEIERYFSCADEAVK